MANELLTSAERVPSMAPRWYVLIIMMLVYTVSIADRYVLSQLLGPIKAEFHLSDAGTASLGIPLALFYVTMGIPLSWMADRANRRNMLVACVAIWSAMTAITGKTQGYWQLMLVRIGVGIGEAGGTPACSAIIADYFPVDRRAMAMTVFALGAPIGGWLGSDIAGAVSAHHGWRAAFMVLGAPGIVLAAVIMLTIREPRRGRLDAVDTRAFSSQVESPDDSENAANQELRALSRSSRIGERSSATPPLLDTLRFLWSQKAAMHAMWAGALSAFWGWGLMWFTPLFLKRSYGMDEGVSGAMLGQIYLWGGIGASLVTAVIVARPAYADPRRTARLLAVVTAVATVPSFLAYYTHNLALAQAMWWLFIPAIYFYIGPAFAMMQNLGPPRMRAMFVAISLLLANVLNLILAPQLVGLLSDWYAHPHAADAASLRFGQLILAPTGFWAAWHYWRAGKYIVEDQKRAVGYD